MFDAFSELFTPGRKHTREEQNRLELTREQVGDSDPGRGPIDLTSGKAVIRLPAAAEPEAAAEGVEDEGQEDEGQEDEGQEDEGEEDESPDGAR
ncbi:hypothetical protein HZZ00_29705 [Streptomyces sp. NEAU-sy36]|uniref:DUF6191 domain-containing protein n=1 Tax=unclassified Streptomyces TaxID=2593676 RepID=UPI0015D62944|nr:MULTISPECIES: DUF6191 domain-containing protein [unclassified Streptomyces]QLJ04776.1 hypothetical protein HZZ00_29705 [Streptomyces sp. NEAU-sy36]